MNTFLRQHLTQQVSPSCACFDVLHNSTWYFCSIHINHKACASCQMKQWLVSWDLQRFALSTEHHVSVSSHRLCAWDPTTSSTQICLHWCYAHLSAVLGLGTYDVHCNHSIWSNDRWAGLRSILHHQLMMVHKQNVWVSTLHTQQWFFAHVSAAPCCSPHRS